MNRKLNKKIRVAIDATPLQGKPSGIPLYTSMILSELVKREDVEFFFYFSCKRPKWDKLDLPNVKARALHPLHRKKWIWFNWIIPFFLKIDRIDLFWGTHQAIPHLFSFKRVKTCFTVHDIAFELFPETLNPTDLIKMKRLFHPSLQKADLVIANSKGTLNKLSPYLQKRKLLPKLAIVNPPVREIFSKMPGQSEIQSTLDHYNLKRGFYLTVGTLEPRKNISHLIKSYRSILSSHTQKEKIPDLVIAGRFGWEGSHLAALIEALQKEHPGKLKLLGFVEDAKLHHLYASAMAYVTSSLYEGYGMPLAEATSLGCKVICPDQEEMIESTSGKAIYYSLTEKGALEKALLSALNPTMETKPPALYPAPSELAADLFDAMTSLLKDRD